jgi:DNA-binding XRE family transcriptional regulator
MTNRLKEIRMRQGIVLRQLTVLSGGVSGSTLSAIERYDYQPAPETREKIAAALGVTVEDIWPEESREPAGVVA